MREQLGQQKGIGPALETHQSHTIKYGDVCNDVCNDDKMFQ